jgi:hypothetical protein
MIPDKIHTITITTEIQCCQMEQTKLGRIIRITQIMTSPTPCKPRTMPTEAAPHRGQTAPVCRADERTLTGQPQEGQWLAEVEILWPQSGHITSGMFVSSRRSASNQILQLIKVNRTNNVDFCFLPVAQAKFYMVVS